MMRAALLLYLPLVVMVMLVPRLLADATLPPALDGFLRNCEPDEQPCWFGLRPGVTSSIQALAVTDMGEEADVIQEAAAQTVVLPPPHPELCRVLIRLEGDMVASIILRFCAGVNVPVGAVLKLLGSPSRVSVDAAEIQYGGFPLESHIIGSPFAPVRVIRLTVPVDLPPVWVGFIPRWRFCQQMIQPVPGCPR